MDIERAIVDGVKEGVREGVKESSSIIANSNQKTNNGGGMGYLAGLGGIAFGIIQFVNGEIKDIGDGNRHDISVLEKRVIDVENVKGRVIDLSQEFAVQKYIVQQLLEEKKGGK